MKFDPGLTKGRYWFDSHDLMPLLCKPFSIDASARTNVQDPTWTFRK